jgi:hypothetical protein
MRGVVWRLSVLIVAVLIAATAVVAFAVRAAVRSQEQRLLVEHTNEVGLVLSTALDGLTQQFDVLGGVLHATSNSPGAFRQSSDGAVSDSDGTRTYALLAPQGDGFVVVLVNGTGLHSGEVISDQRVAALVQAENSGVLVPTPIVGSGATRTVGFAIGPPVAPVGTVLYQQNTLGALGPPQAAATAPFSELNVVLYDAMTPDPSQALVSTVPSPPLTGEVRTQFIKAGNTNLLLQVSPARPLVGGLTPDAAWLIFGGGFVMAILVGVAVETETRRRRAAVALYQGEHRLTEVLQRSLLPHLPSIPGLQIGARYLAGSEDQQVGGDWYDVFELTHGRIGIVVGDVVGHDVSAAVLMSRVQTALRAYAFLDEQPAGVLDRLDGLLATFDTERLVTVFYGVLSAPDRSGHRRLVFANAGHPPPLVRGPDGLMSELDGAESLLLGLASDSDGGRPQREVELHEGSMLLLYTDGLVEIPGESLTDLIERLKAVAATIPSGASPDDACEWLLARLPGGERRDDIAIMVTQLVSSRVPRQSAIDLRESAPTG